jgi:hypothetical protein
VVGVQLYWISTDRWWPKWLAADVARLGMLIGAHNFGW